MACGALLKENYHSKSIINLSIKHSCMFLCISTCVYGCLNVEKYSERTDKTHRCSYFCRTVGTEDYDLNPVLMLCVMFQNI